MNLETVVNLIVRHLKEISPISDDEAIEMIYTSRIYKLIENVNNGLWSESPCYLGELVLAESQGEKTEIYI